MGRNDSRVACPQLVVDNAWIHAGRVRDGQTFCVLVLGETGHAEVDGHLALQFTPPDDGGPLQMLLFCRLLGRVISQAFGVWSRMKSTAARGQVFAKLHTGIGRNTVFWSMTTVVVLIKRDYTVKTTICTALIWPVKRERPQLQERTNNVFRNTSLPRCGQTMPCDRSQVRRQMGIVANVELSPLASTAEAASSSVGASHNGQL